MVVNGRIELKGDSLFIDDVEFKNPKRIGKFWKYEITKEENWEIGLLLHWERVFWGEDYSDFRAYLYGYKRKKYFIMLESFESRLAGNINLLTYEIPKLIKRNGDWPVLFAMYDGYKVKEDAKVYAELHLVANDLFDSFSSKVIKLQLLKEVFYNKVKALFKEFSNEIAPKLYFDIVSKNKNEFMVMELLASAFFSSNEYARRFIESIKKCESKLEESIGVECINDYMTMVMNSALTKLTAYKSRNELRLVMWLIMGGYDEEVLCDVIKKVLSDTKSPLTLIINSNNKVDIIPINEKIFEEEKGFIFSSLVVDFKEINEIYKEILKLEKEVGINE